MGFRRCLHKLLSLYRPRCPLCEPHRAAGPGSGPKSPRRRLVKKRTPIPGLEPGMQLPEAFTSQLPYPAPEHLEWLRRHASPWEAFADCCSEEKVECESDGSSEVLEVVEKKPVGEKWSGNVLTGRLTGSTWEGGSGVPVSGREGGQKPRYRARFLEVLVEEEE